MSNIKSIGEGQTFDLIAHGTVIILVGVPIGMFTYHLIAVIFFFIGILFILMSSGIQLDNEQNRIRKYRSLLGFKFGVWRTLSDVKKIELRYFIEGLSGSSSFLAASNTSRVKNFELFLILSNNEEQKFHSFTELKPAYRVMKVLKKEFRIELDNQVTKFHSNVNERAKRR